MRYTHGRDADPEGPPAMSETNDRAVPDAAALALFNDCGSAALDQVRTHNTEKLEETLYHYTTVDGLKGILTSRSLWASKTRYLNDAVEFNHGTDIALARVRELRDDVTKSKRAKDAAVHLRRVLDEESSFSGVFVTCLCTSSDMLSQWRAYGNRGCGVSIGLRREALARLPGVTMNAVCYSWDHQQKIVHQYIDSIIMTYCESCGDDDAPKPEIDEAMRLAFTRGLSGLASFLKHPDFYEEREVRLVADPPDQPGAIQFRSRGDLLIPYVAIDLGDALAATITRITIGPHSRGPLLKASIAEFLKSQGLPVGDHAGEIAVDISHVPFRPEL